MMSKYLLSISIKTMMPCYAVEDFGGLIDNATTVQIIFQEEVEQLFIDKTGSMKVHKRMMQIFLRTGLSIGTFLP